MAKKLVEEEVVEETSEDNTVDKIAELTINLDLEREKKEELENKLSALQKKYDDEHRANIRLMSRISEKEEMQERNETKQKAATAKITDLYDFKSGKLVLK